MLVTELDWVTGCHSTSSVQGHYFQDQETKLTSLIYRNKRQLRRQRSMSQMKEDKNYTKKDLYEMKISNIPDKGFKVIVIKILILI